MYVYMYVYTCIKIRAYCYNILQLVSVFTAEEIDNVIRHLCAFKQVIEEHSLISSTTAMHHSFSQSTRHIADSRSSAGKFHFL